MKRFIVFFIMGKQVLLPEGKLNIQIFWAVPNPSAKAWHHAKNVFKPSKARNICCVSRSFSFFLFKNDRSENENMHICFENTAYMKTRSQGSRRRGHRARGPVQLSLLATQKGNYQGRILCVVKSWENSICKAVKRIL